MRNPTLWEAAEVSKNVEMEPSQDLRLVAWYLQEVIWNKNGILSLIFLNKQESPEAGAHSLD